MKNAYKVLTQKRVELAQLQREIEALELVIPMLDEAEKRDAYGPTAIEAGVGAAMPSFNPNTEPKSNGKGKAWP